MRLSISYRSRVLFDLCTWWCATCVSCPQRRHCGDIFLMIGVSKLSHLFLTVESFGNFIRHHQLTRKGQKTQVLQEVRSLSTHGQ